MGLGIDPESHAPVTLTRDMGDPRGRAPPGVLVGLQRGYAPAVVPGHRAVVRRGAPRSKAFWPVGERVPMGLEASWAPRVSSSGVDSGEACRLAVIASGEHVTPGTQVRRRDHAGQWLQSASEAWGLWGWSVAEGGVGSTRRESAPVAVRSSPARAALSRPLARRP